VVKHLRHAAKALRGNSAEAIVGAPLSE